jgi:hypothetical protein
MNALVELWGDWGSYIRVRGLSTQGETRAGFSRTMIAQGETRAGFSPNLGKIGLLHSCRRPINSGGKLRQALVDPCVLIGKLGRASVELWINWGTYIRVGTSVYLGGN